MLLKEKEVSVVASGMKDSVEFSANLDGLMFDNLINGIYSNKIGAGIREYSTNARDGHARANCLDTPFEVGLPTSGNPTFEVRDFGSSLTHDEVFEIFTVLGKSTKRDSNNETGCLGLGSKSAFAYTNSFTVTCWLNGEKRDYACYIGNEGRPVASLLSTVKSNEPQGLRISYAVKAEDVDSFNKEASTQLRGFEPQPKIIRKNSSYSGLDDSEILIKGDGWTVYSSKNSSLPAYNYNYASGKPMAIQGSVAYPIDHQNSALKAEIYKLPVNERNLVTNLLSKTNVVIRFDIGELRMTTSREELAYEETTVKNIVNKTKDVINKIQKQLDKEYEDCKTMKEARLLYAKSSDGESKSIDAVLGVSARYFQGKAISSDFNVVESNGKIKIHDQRIYYYANTTHKPIFEMDGGMRIEREHIYRNAFGEYKSQFKWKAESNTNAVLEMYRRCDKFSDIQILIDVESEYTDKNFNAIMRRYWKEVLGSNTLYSKFAWFKVKSISDGEKLIDALYIDDRSNITWLHELEELKMPKAAHGSKAPTSQKTLRILKSKRWCYGSDRAEYETIDFANQTEKLPVVFSCKSQFYWTEQDMAACVNGMTHQEMRPTLYHWGDDLKVYVINANTLKFHKDNPKHFRNAIEYLVEEWKKKNSDWESKYANSTVKSNNYENIEMAIKLMKLKKKHGLVFKPIESNLVADRNLIESANSTSKNTFNIPPYGKTWMKKELEQALQKHPNGSTKLETYLDFVNKDPVLKYLIHRNDYDGYGVDDTLADAIKHHVKTNYS